MFSSKNNDPETPTCSSPVQSAISSSSLNDLDESLRKLTIDKKINIRPLSSKRNPFKAGRKKTNSKSFSGKCTDYSTKGIEEITDQMVQLWCSEGYREPNSKELSKKKHHRDNKKTISSSTPTTSSASSNTSSAVTTSTKSSDSNPNEGLTCARQANCDYSDSPSVNELAAYFEEGLFFPKKMSFMAEMMYT